MRTVPTPACFLARWCGAAGGNRQSPTPVTLAVFVENRVEVPDADVGDDGLTKRADQRSLVKVQPTRRSGRYGSAQHDAPVPGQSSGKGVRDAIAPAQPLISGDPWWQRAGWD